MDSVEAAYRDACSSDTLPEVVLLTADKEGTFEYRKAMGYRSLKLEKAAKAIEPDTVLAMASCTKLMTAIAVLQCVERGLFDLDENAARIFQELKTLEIISKAEGVNNNPRLKQRKNTNTPRQNIPARAILLT